VRGVGPRKFLAAPGPIVIAVRSPNSAEISCGVSPVSLPSNLSPRGGRSFGVELPYRRPGVGTDAYIAMEEVVIVYRDLEVSQ